MKRGKCHAHRTLRYYHEIRSAHLERLASSEPCLLLYGSRRYDFDPSLLDGAERHEIRGAGLRECFTTAIGRKWRIVEVPEPAVLRAAPRSLALLLAARFAKLAGSRATVVTYAIENLEPAELFGVRLLPKWLRRALVGAWFSFALSLLDRVAYGSPAAERLYRSTGRPLRRPSEAAIPALPAACPCLGESSPPKAGVLFVGALETRKGIDRLLASWSLVGGRTGAHLTVLGIGPMAGAALEWAAGRTDASVSVNPPRQAIHSAMARARVVVLLSQREPGWREQIGLPLVEGLAHGCRLVTTSETGLADCLAQLGMHVLAPDAAVTAIADAIVEAHAAPSGDAVLALLPREDGRREAERWLHAS